MASGPYATEKDFVDQFVEGMVYPNAAMTLYAVIDKTCPTSKEDKDGSLAGMLCYSNSSVANLSTEISFVITLPSFQGSHVASNAVGLLLQYALNPPEKYGLGLRRVQWQTSSVNATSIRLAEKMGFRREGLLRWDRVFHGGKAKGKAGNDREDPRGGNGEHLGRDTAIFSLCWDDWEQGGGEKVQAITDRRQST
ncbi:MAG: hypothetical protein M1839_002876 [Geoglossum umbratile]|nr:MAG: hypothetical protein M1839_002876 [Geoglossum umbratile]